MKITGKIIFFLVTIFFLSNNSLASSVINLDFDDSDNYTNLQLEAPKVLAEDAFVKDCTLYRIGKCSVKIKIKNSVDYFQDGNHRVEFRLMKNLDFQFGPGDLFKYSFSVYIPTEYENDVRDSVDIIWQFKNFNNAPNAFIGIKGDDIVLNYLNDGQITLYKNFPKGVWVDIKLEILWSYTGEGYFNTYIASTKDKSADFMFIKHIRNLRDSKPKNNYIKFGIYKPSYEKSISKKDRIIYLDSIKIEKLN